MTPTSWRGLGQFSADYFNAAHQMSPITSILDQPIHTHPYSFQTKAIYELLLHTMILSNLDVQLKQ